MIARTLALRQCDSNSMSCAWASACSRESNAAQACSIDTSDRSVACAMACTISRWVSTQYGVQVIRVIVGCLVAARTDVLDGSTDCWPTTISSQSGRRSGLSFWMSTSHRTVFRQSEMPVRNGSQCCWCSIR